MSSSVEFRDLVVTVRREEKNRSKMGRASRRANQEVISGRLGLRALEKRTCQQGQNDRGLAALLEGQLVTLPKDAMVSIVYELAEDNIAST